MSHEAVYTRVLYPLPASRIWPVMGSCLCSKRTRGRPRQPGGSASIRSWGWSALVDHPLRMWLFVGSQGAGRVT